MISTHSDKALLELAKKGSDTAASILLRRWGIAAEHNRLNEIIKEWKTMKTLSVGAAKRIALSV